MSLTKSIENLGKYDSGITLPVVNVSSNSPGELLPTNFSILNVNDGTCPPIFGSFVFTSNKLYS